LQATLAPDGRDEELKALKQQIEGAPRQASTTLPNGGAVQLAQIDRRCWLYGHGRW
jgi:hypothetical protein